MIHIRATSGKKMGTIAPVVWEQLPVENEKNWFFAFSATFGQKMGIVALAALVATSNFLSFSQFFAS